MLVVSFFFICYLFQTIPLTFFGGCANLDLTYAEVWKPSASFITVHNRLVLLVNLTKSYGITLCSSLGSFLRICTRYKIMEIGKQIFIRLPPAP